MVADELIRIVSLLLVGLLLVGAGHKLRVQLRGEASTEPLIRARGWRRRHATLALMGAAGIEFVAAALLLVRPLAGFILAIAVISVYTVELGRLPRSEGCNCFGGFLEAMSPRVAMIRNVALIGIAAASLGVYALGRVEPAPLSEWNLGLALVLTALAAGIEAVRRLSRQGATQVLSNQEGGVT